MYQELLGQYESFMNPESFDGKGRECWNKENCFALDLLFTK